MKGLVFKSWLSLGCAVAISACVVHASGGEVIAPETRGSATDAIAENVELMTMSDVVEQIRNKDWTFTESGIPVDPSVVPAAVLLCDDEDAEIRELSLYALSGIKGQAARSCIINGLHDEDVNVRSTASRFIRENYSPDDISPLHQELQTNEDELVRESVLLTLGLIRDPSSRLIIKEYAGSEEDPHAAHAAKLAMVRLGVKEYKEQYAASFGDADPAVSVRALQDFEYVRDQQFLPLILPLLDDERNGLNVGPSKSKIWLRVCDVAVNVLSEVYGQPFPFEVNDLKQYTMEERRQVVGIMGSE